MRIKTQLLLTILLFGIILTVIAASAVITNQRIGSARAQEETANRVGQGASELGYLSNDYVIYGESQLFSRWQSRYASFSSDVSSLRGNTPEQQALVRGIQANAQRMKDVFDSIVPVVGNSSQNPAIDVTSLQVSWSRMAVQSQGLVSDASRLHQMSSAEVDRSKQENTTILFLMVGAFGAYFVVNYLVVQRRTLKELAKLQAGASVIGSGNLDFQIEEKKNDEVGDLSRAFNRMTTSLKEVTASKSDLEQEVAERKKAEAALRESEQRWATTLASVGDGVIATDTAGKVTFMNPVAEVLTGYRLREALRKPVEEVFPIVNERTRQAVENPVVKVLKEGKIVGLANHTVLVRRDGTEVPIDDSGAPILDQEGRITGVVLIFRDITERKKTEDLKEEFLGLISHEMKTPLTVMLGACE